MVANPETMQEGRLVPGERQTIERFTILALRSGQTYTINKYQRDGDLLMFQDSQGRKGGVSITDVDWRKTSEMTAAVRSGDAPMLARQTN
jgi:hypothetical protein